MTVKEIPVAELHENDYNPRTRFDDAAMANLKESISNIGLVQPLTVRQNEGGYEVISGVRRLRALRDVEDESTEVPCLVRDVDDETAKLIALTENLEREDMTPIEEARAYAEYVDVTVDGEKQNYAEYIKGAENRNAILSVPSNRNPTVGTLAEKIYPSAGTIKDRLVLLVLPESVQEDIENDELRLDAGKMIAKLRQIPDAEQRNKAMKRFAVDPRFRGSNLDRKELRQQVNSTIQNYEEEQKREEEQIEAFTEQAQAAFDALQNETHEKIQWYNENTDDECEPDVTNGYVTLVDSVLEAYQGRMSELGGERQTDLDDEIQDIRQEKNRLEENISIVREEDHSRCPFCKAHVLIPDLEDRVEEYEREIESVEEQKRELSSEREEYKERRTSLRKKRKDYDKALSDLGQYVDDPTEVIEG